jgi:hypothetical protein
MPQIISFQHYTVTTTLLMASKNGENGDMCVEPDDSIYNL